MRSLRHAASLFAATVVVAPLATGVVLATAPAAQAGSGDGPVINLYETRLWFSPNKDNVKDKARVSFFLAKKATVTVKVRRDNEARTLVYEQDLGKLAAGPAQTWKWNGKDFDNDVVRDGKYSAIFIVKQTGKAGEKRIRSMTLWVDTAVARVTPELSLDTVYPQTTQIRDAINVFLPRKNNLSTITRVELRVRDAQDRLVSTSNRFGTFSWPKYAAVLFDGRDNAGAPLPGGTYLLRVKMTDFAGNVGTSKRVNVNVAAQPLVEKTGSLVVRPAGAQNASQVLAGRAPSAASGSSMARVADGRSSTTANDPAARPCGTVTPSTVYATAGAQSFRSADTCTAWYMPHMAWADGSLQLDNLTLAQAPRGLYSWRTSMRGRPTVAGETDTAELHLARMELGLYGGTHTHGAVSPTSSDETVTSTGTAVAPAKVTYEPWDTAPTIRWVIATHGVDSFDVADVTVHYSYLTPQR